MLPEPVPLPGDVDVWAFAATAPAATRADARSSCFRDFMEHSHYLPTPKLVNPNDHSSFRHTLKMAADPQRACSSQSS
jgi:hypothetical protein